MVNYFVEMTLSFSNYDLALKAFILLFYNFFFNKIKFNTIKSHSHVTMRGSKSQASGSPMGLFHPDVLHLNTGCWSCVGPLTAMHWYFLISSEFVI